MTEDEREVYRRQLLIPGWGDEAQNKLAAATVFVAGAGGLGSPVLLYLAAAGIGHLVICDSDTVEPSNLNRQILHSSKRLGMTKIVSANMTLSDLNPAVQITTVKARIHNRNAASVIGSPDIIIDCLDSFESRLALNRYAVRTSLPMIHGGIEAMRGQITLLKSPETPCLACILPKAGKRRTIPVLGATAGVIGSLQALEALKYLTGIGTTLAHRILFWDGVEMKFDSIAIAKNPDCTVCGGK